MTKQSSCPPPNQCHDPIDITDTIEESLELSMADLVLNRVFIERHFPQQSLYVHGNKKELLLILGYLIFNAIEAMDGLALKVLKITMLIDHEAARMVVRFLTSDGPSAHWGLNKSDHRIPNRKNGYCQWLKIAESVMARHGGEIAVHSRPGKGLNVALDLPIMHPIALTGCNSLLGPREGR